MAHQGHLESGQALGRAGALAGNCIGKDFPGCDGECCCMEVGMVKTSRAEVLLI